MNESKTFWVAMVSAIVGLFFGFAIGRSDGIDSQKKTSIEEIYKAHEGFRNAAVEAGKAEYYLDQNNNRQWRWK